jgi:3-oxoacyl-[acyl-carrier-protein] synthase III
MGTGGKLSSARSAQILSTGGYVPGPPIGNEAIERLVGPLPEGLLESMHMHQRHWMIDPATGEHLDSNSGMAAKALAQALERAGLEPDELELLIVATASPDYALPPTVALVQDLLGIARCATFELRSGGAGVVQGLDMARLYLESGQYRTAAVIGCDAISPLQAQYFAAGARIKVRERMIVYMFGDGAGAVIMQAGEGPGAVGSAIGCIGTGRPPGMQILGGGGTYAPMATQRAGRYAIELRIDIAEASTFTATLMTEALADVLEATGTPAEEIDLLVTPEADTEWMVSALTDRGMPPETWAALAPKIVNALPRIGAPGCAALPLGLDEAWRSGRIAPGQRLLLLGMETTKWIYAGLVVDWTAPPPPDGLSS